MSYNIDPFAQDLLACFGEPETGEWRMIVTGGPHQITRLHEAHFAMTREGVVVKHRWGLNGCPKDDPYREHGLKILALMGTDWIAGAVPQG